MTRIKNKVVFLEYNLQGNVKNLSTRQIYDGNKLGGHLGKIVDGYNYMLKSGDANYKNQVITLIKSKNIHHVDATNKSRNQVLPGSRNESIKESIQKAKEGIPIGTTTNYNFSEDKLSNGLPKTNRTSVAHEVQHQYDYDQGNMKDSFDKKGDIITNRDKNPSEQRGIKNEERARKDADIPTRNTYY